jgi:integrase
LSKEQIDQHFSETLPNLAYDSKHPEKRLARNSIVNIWRVLSIALNKAVDDEIIIKNPMTAITAPKRDGKTRKLAETDFGISRRIMRNIEGNDDEARWIIACLGVRQSERLGLRWSDIQGLDNKRGTATLEISGVLARKDVSHGCGQRDGVTMEYPCGEKVASKCSKQIGEGGFYWRNEAKNTSSERVLPIVEPLRTVLRAHKVRQDEWRKSPHWKPHPGEHMNDLVFTTQKGKPIRQTQDTKDWHALLERLRIPYINGHKLRHLTISELAKSGVPMPIIQSIVGHSRDSKITQAVYTHINTKAMVEPLTAYSDKMMSERKAK